MAYGSEHDLQDQAAAIDDDTDLQDDLYDGDEVEIEGIRASVIDDEVTLSKYHFEKLCKHFTYRN